MENNENNVNKVDYEEAMKQMREDVLSKEHYVHIELIITPDEKEHYARVDCNKIDSETYGKAILGLKETLKTMMENADPAALLYCLTHSTTSKNNIIDKNEKGGN